MSSTSTFDEKKCRHCQSRKPDYGRRGLCTRCHDDRAIREQYPPVSRFGRKADTNWESDTRLPAPPPDQPTDAQPGSAAKILVLIARAEARQQLFHPLDKSCLDDALDNATLIAQRRNERQLEDRPEGWTDRALQVEDGKIWGGRQRRRRRKKRRPHPGPCPESGEASRVQELSL